MTRCKQAGILALAVAITVWLAASATAGPVPAPWVSQDIGTTLPGSADLTAGVFTIVGDGGDIWGNADAFHFVSQPWSGDFTSAVRITSQQNTDGWAKAGIMARADTSAGSIHTNISATPSNYVTMQWRDSAGGGSGNAGAIPGSSNSGSAPFWLLMQRRGNDFITRVAQDDGTGHPTYFGVPQRHTSASMPSSVLLGMHVTSHNGGALSQVTFDNVQMGNYALPTTTPPPFTSADVGSGVRAGSTEFYANSGTVVIEGGGGDIWGNADAFRYVYAPITSLGLTGDFTATVRLIAQENSDAWAKAGIMARETATDPGSRQVNVIATPGNGVNMQWRDTTGGGSAGSPRLAGSPNSTQDGSAPIWLSLQRRGDQYTAYWAPDVGGAPGAWTSSAPYVSGAFTSTSLGLAVTAHNSGSLSDAIFDNIDVQAGASLFGTPLDSIDTSLTGVSTHIVHPTYGLGDADGAANALNLRPGDLQHVVSQVTTIPMINLDTHGQFGNNVGVLAGNERSGGAGADDYALGMAGYIHAGAGEVRSFLVRHDDAFRMWIGDSMVADLTGWDNGSAQTFEVEFPTEGYWPVRIVAQQGGGGLGWELASKLASDPDYQLVGDTANGGIPVYQRPDGVPDPSEAGPNHSGPALNTGPPNPAAADGLRVQVLTSPGTLGNIDDAISLLKANERSATPDNSGVVKSSVFDYGSGGNFSLNNAFPADTAFTGNNFAMRINGLIYIDTPGDYTVAVGTDDGYQLRIANNPIRGEVAGGRGIPTGTANMNYVHFDQAGFYPVEFYMYQGTGGYATEISAAPSPGLILSSRDPAASGFTPDLTGMVYSVEPVAKLTGVGGSLMGKAMGYVPALGRSINPEYWTLQQKITGAGPRVAGLLGQYYQYSGGTPDWDDTLTPVGTRSDLQSGDFTFGDNYAYGPWGNLEDQFGVRWTGYLDVPETGKYSFHMASDDRSWIFIDTNGDGTLDAAPGNDAWDVYWNDVDLAEGLHKVEFRAREFGGGENSYLDWMLPFSTSWQRMPVDVLSQGLFDDAYLSLAFGTNRVGNADADGLLMDFPLDASKTYDLRLITMVAGLTAMDTGVFTFVPEPGSWLLLTLGGLALLACRRRRRR